jgi:dTDP-4-amino-4,6-dideoxygalactose transaminase
MNDKLRPFAQQPTYVTVPFLPPYEEYTELQKTIWERQWLTNQGPLAKELEAKLAAYLGLDALHLVANGTLALQLTYHAFQLQGEVLTTPFTYIATSSSLLWEGCQPRFADIDPETFNLDPAAARRAITPQTKAIVATHVFGNACDIGGLASIANEAGIPLIYDASHAFGTTYHGKSLFAYGDASTLSLHATKLFHTVEGGFITSPHPDTLTTVERTRRFGHDTPETFSHVGINAKMSEFHAAMGLVNLRYADQLQASRKRQCELYRKILGSSPDFQFQKIQDGCTYNHAYMPVLLPDTTSVERIITRLAEAKVYPKRYFHPSLADLPHLGLHGHCPHAHDIASRILCLPLSHTYSDELIEAIAIETLDAVSSTTPTTKA